MPAILIHQSKGTGCDWRRDISPKGHDTGVHVISVVEQTEGHASVIL